MNGMSTLIVDHVRSVIVCKRSLEAGFAREDKLIFTVFFLIVVRPVKLQSVRLQTQIKDRLSR